MLHNKTCATFGQYFQNISKIFLCDDCEGTIEPLEDEKVEMSDEEWIEKVHGEEDH